MTDRPRPVRWIDRYLQDALEVSRRPDGAVERSIPMGLALTVQAEIKLQGEPVSLHHVILRAAALAVRQVPRVQWLRSGYRLIEPDSVDVSSAVHLPLDLPFAPLVVIPGADRLGLPELARAFRLKRDELPGRMEEMVRKVNRWGWLLPLGFLRRAMIRRLQRNWRLQRQLCGTFQVSSMRRTGAHAATSWLMAPSSLLVVGAIQEEPEPRIRFTLHVDHRVYAGMTAGRYLEELDRILNDPDLLMGRVEDSEPRQ